ncbi:MAG: PKD domain-containing protein [Bacteroidia bacterium]|nr:PKD domain-containing protein [Bacteroidia bacterium]
MGKNLLIGFLLMLCMLIVMAGCTKENVPEKLPELKIIPKPAQGLTTDVFEITVDPVTEGRADRTLFFRWDWNNDGTWDTPFSTGNQVKHRFLLPGLQVIRLEYADGKKLVKTANLTIEVEQGYSAPRPAFKVKPGNGNILTVFTFDAGLTQDDEDSLEQLKFKWDFWGDGRWTPEYSNNPITTWQYSTQGLYHPKLEARDPSGRSATFSGELTVTMEDSLIIPDFTINDTLIRVKDTLLLDASASHHSRYPLHELLFSWFLPDRMDWTIADTAKTRILKVGQTGQTMVKLKVIDKETGLFNQVTKEFYVADENLPPRAKIQAGSTYGNILTQFYFDSWLSRDDNQIPSDLEVRWDFDGDGVWDTSYSRDKFVYHQFESPGQYLVYLQVRDNEGLTSSDKKQIYVSANTDQTGFFKDQRDGTYYGTVKIGNQWWMSQNLNYTIPQKFVSGIYQWICLFEQQKWCDQVGKLYRVGAFVKSQADEEYMVICPGGWRLPSREDWETLFNSIGGEQNCKELRYGGKYDFNAWDLGYADYYIMKPFPGAKPDTIYRFNQTYQVTWFFSSTDRKDPIKENDVWMWTVDRANGTPWTGFGLANIYIPIRCVKEE